MDDKTRGARGLGKRTNEGAVGGFGGYADREWQAPMNLGEKGRKKGGKNGGAGEVRLDSSGMPVIGSGRKNGAWLLFLSFCSWSSLVCFTDPSSPRCSQRVEKAALRSPLFARARSADCNIIFPFPLTPPTIRLSISPSLSIGDLDSSWEVSWQSVFAAPSPVLFKNAGALQFCFPNDGSPQSFTNVLWSDINARLETEFDSYAGDRARARRPGRLFPHHQVLPFSKPRCTLSLPS